MNGKYVCQDYHVALELFEMALECGLQISNDYIQQVKEKIRTRMVIKTVITGTFSLPILSHQSAYGNLMTMALFSSLIISPLCLDLEITLKRNFDCRIINRIGNQSLFPNT